MVLIMNLVVYSIDTSAFVSITEVTEIIGTHIKKTV